MASCMSTLRTFKCSGMVPSRFGDESILAGGNCNGLIVWLGSSAVRVLAR